MRILTFAKTLIVLTVPAGVGVFLSAPKGLTNTLAAFLQLEALALAGAILYTVAKPFVFGVQKGEQVLLITNDPMSSAINVRLATALSDGKLHQNIKIGMGGSMEATATVESYSGIITPARVSVKPENTISVI
jgi:hypothetical protein